MKKTFKIGFLVLFLLICMIPSLGLVVTGISDGLSESGEETVFPSLKNVDEEGESWNLDFLSDLGDWFEQKFAFREELVSAYGLVTGKVFGTSSQEQVIVGTDGWLYFTDTLSDYQGTDLMTERQLFDAAHTLAMIQTYAEQNGIDFIFTIAPNKASLYDEHMPYYYSSFCSDENNLSHFLPWLESEGVNYVDLYAVFEEQDEVLYHARDSHWNNKGAALAADTLLTALGQEHVSYENADYEIRTDYIGDLDEMIYPSAETPEEEIYYDPEPQFTYVSEVESNYDRRIYTLSDAEGSLLMYRDSFGNALLPFMAENYGSACFTRDQPYQLNSDLASGEFTALVIESAERFIPNLATNAPSLAYGYVADESADDLDYTADITNLVAAEAGAYTKITGTLEEGSYEVDSRIYIRISGDIYSLTFEAFPFSLEDGAEGFVLYVDNTFLGILGGEEYSYEMGLS